MLRVPICVQGTWMASMTASTAPDCSATCSPSSDALTQHVRMLTASRSDFSA